VKERKKEKDLWAFFLLGILFLDGGISFIFRGIDNFLGVVSWCWVAFLW
jgi:hypothetical protein